MVTKNLTRNIFIALGTGIVFGLIMSIFNGGDGTYNIVYALVDAVGTMFLNGLKLIVVPLVFFSIIVGISSLHDTTKVARIGGKAIFYYMLSTIVAVSFALIIALFLHPGSNVDLSAMVVSEVETTTPENVTLLSTIVDVVPTNIFEAMVTGNMLQIIFTATIMGIAFVKLGDKARGLQKIFVQSNDLMLMITSMIMKFAPYGVFALISKTFMETGAEALAGLASYIIVMYIVFILFIILFYMPVLKFLGKISPIKFFKAILPVMTLGFSTASSNATIPTNIETLEKKLGVNKDITSFMIPLGATINMNGTAIMQGVATVFLLNVYGITLEPIQYIVVISVTVIASIGTAGVPGVGVVMLAMVLSAVGLPVEGVGLIIGVDRIVDMGRTALNITGDAVFTYIVARTEKALDEVEE